MKTPNELFETFEQLATDAKCGITDLMLKHNISSLNTHAYIYEHNFDLIDVGVYERHMDAMFYEPVSSVILDNEGLHIFYSGESSGECYDPTITDWLNVYSLVFDILSAVDAGEVELITA